MADPNDICSRWNCNARLIDGRPVIEVDIHDTMLDVRANFCYLDHMLCSGGICDCARGSSGNFSVSPPPGTSDLRCATSCTWHASTQNASVPQGLCRNDRTMICWICGTKDRDETPSASLLQELGYYDNTSLLVPSTSWNLKLTTP